MVERSELSETQVTAALAAFTETVVDNLAGEWSVSRATWCVRGTHGRLLSVGAFAAETRAALPTCVLFWWCSVKVQTIVC